MTQSPTHVPIEYSVPPQTPADLPPDVIREVAVARDFHDRAERQVQALTEVGRLVGGPRWVPDRDAWYAMLGYQERMRRLWGGCARDLVSAAADKTGTALRRMQEAYERRSAAEDGPCAYDWLIASQCACSCATAVEAAYRAAHGSPFRLP